jgi:hypothetical protein
MAIYRWRRIGKPILLILGLILSIWTCVHIQQIPSTIKFFYLMIKIPPPRSDEYSLDEVKQVALLLLEQSEPERRRLIRWYDFYARYGTDCIAAGFKALVLNRFLFDIPEDYPRTKGPPGLDSYGQHFPRTCYGPSGMMMNGSWFSMI